MYVPKDAGKFRYFRTECEQSANRVRGRLLPMRLQASDDDGRGGGRESGGGGRIGEISAGGCVDRERSRVEIENQGL